MYKVYICLMLPQYNVLKTGSVNAWNKVSLLSLKLSNFPLEHSRNFKHLIKNDC